MFHSVCVSIATKIYSTVSLEIIRIFEKKKKNHNQIFQFHSHFSLGIISRSSLFSLSFSGIWLRLRAQAAMILYAYERRHQKGIEKNTEKYILFLYFQWIKRLGTKQRKRHKRGTELKLNKTTQAIAHEHFSFNLTLDRVGSLLSGCSQSITLEWSSYMCIVLRAWF